jgi:hypothetical protein
MQPLHPANLERHLRFTPSNLDGISDAATLEPVMLKSRANVLDQIAAKKSSRNPFAHALGKQ